MSEWDAFPMAVSPMAVSAPQASSEWDAFPQAPQPSVGIDVAKSAGIGLAKGVIGGAGLMGDLRQLSMIPGEKLANYLGVDPAQTEQLKSIIEGITSRVGPLAGPTSAQARQSVENLTGPLYEPKTVPGQYAQTVGEFVPASLTGPGGIAKRVATQAVIPGLASEAAGQATQGTAAEPYARIAAAVASGAAPGLLAKNAAKTTIQEVKDAASAGYKDPTIAAVQLDPKAVETVANSAISDLKRAKLNERLAPQTHAILDDLKTPVTGAVHTLEDFETTRQLLGDVAGKFADPVEQKAASQAIKFLDKYRENIPSGHIVAGDADAAQAAVSDARTNYASAKTAEKVSEKLRNADLRASSTYSGGNLNNATRQNLRTLLTSKSQGRGLTTDELQSIEDTVRGSTIGNALRAGGKLLGGGGGLGAIGTGAAGHMLAGPIGLLAPAVGYGVKKLGDAVTRSNSDKIVQQILARSPAGRAKATSLPPNQNVLNFWRQILLANPASLSLRLPVNQSQAQ